MLSNGLANLSMDELEQMFHRSAKLIKACAKTQLASGKTLEEALTIGGINFWDVISPSLAAGPIPYAFAQTKKKPLMGRSSLFFRTCKEKLFKTGLPLITNVRGCRKWPNTPSILFLGFSHYMFRETLETVAESIYSKKEFCPVILTDSRNIGMPIHAPNELVSNSIWEHWDAETSSVAAKYLKEFNNVVSHPSNHGFLRNIFQGKDALLLSSVENNLLWIFNVFLPRMMLYAAVAKHILEKHAPSLIVSPDVNDPRTRIYTLLARNLKIPSLEVQLSFYLKKDVEWQFFVADHLAVTGEENRNVMAYHGIPPDRMTVTGSARYDKLVNLPPEQKSEKLRKLGIPSDKTILVFASQPYVYGVSSHSPEARIAIIKSLFELMGVFNRYHLVVKPHPLEESQSLQSLSPGHSNITFVDKTSDIRELISIGDAFVTFCSNTTFDALARNKPTIVLSSICSLFEESGAVLVARSQEDLSSHLTIIQNGIPPELQKKLDVAREKLIRQWLFKTDGLAKDRIESLVMTMARSCLKPNKV